MIDLAPQAQKVFLRKAIDAIVADPEPDGVTKFWADVATGYSGCLLNEVYPWRIVYQVVGGRPIIVAIEIHPGRIPFM